MLDAWGGGGKRSGTAPAHALGAAALSPQKPLPTRFPPRQPSLPLTSFPTHPAPPTKQAGGKISTSLTDEENPYLSSAAPPPAPPPTLTDRVRGEARARWWLWGALLAATALAGGLLTFRDALYDGGAHGVPTLAIKGNAAETCAAVCREFDTPAAADDDHPAEAYAACYAKCVEAEARDVVEERELFKKEEEEIEAEEAAAEAEEATAP